MVKIKRTMMTTSNDVTATNVFVQWPATLNYSTGAPASTEMSTGYFKETRR